MYQRLLLFAILAQIIIPAGTLGLAHGQAVNIVISRDTVTLNMNLALRENLTALPEINTKISLANTTSTVQPIIQTINNALQNLVESARVSSLNINVKTSNSSSTWLMDENYTIVVAGANTDSGSNIASNLSFIAMNLTQPIQIGSTEINGVGPTYLLPALVDLAAANPNLVFFIDGSNPRTPLIPEQTTKTFWLLDFTSVPPVSTWNTNNDILAQSTQWTLNPTNPKYNLTLGVPSPEGPILAAYVALYSLSIGLTIPANAWVNGNTVSYDTPTPTEIIMPAILVTSIAIAIATVFLDWKVAKPIRARRKR